ncbi:hypothetical protein SNE40_007093 [Patella caerulea]
MIEPLQRSSLWRRGEPGSARNIQDGDLNCGGFERQWIQNDGCCGVCGDPCDGVRENEFGGRYAQNIIASKYFQGATIPVTIVRTNQQSLGYFEFRICEPPENQAVTQECLNRNLLQIQESDFATQFYPGSGGQTFQLNVKLPPDLFCTRCILQFKYNTGYRSPEASSGCDCLGCGQQEQFFNCADVSIERDVSYIPSSTSQDSNTPMISSTKPQILLSSSSSLLISTLSLYSVTSSLPSSASLSVEPCVCSNLSAVVTVTVNSCTVDPITIRESITSSSDLIVESTSLQTDTIYSSTQFYPSPTSEVTPLSQTSSISDILPSSALIDESTIKLSTSLQTDTPTRLYSSTIPEATTLSTIHTTGSDMFTVTGGSSQTASFQVEVATTPKPVDQTPNLSFQLLNNLLRLVKKLKAQYVVIFENGVKTASTYTTTVCPTPSIPVSTTVVTVTETVAITVSVTPVVSNPAPVQSIIPTPVTSTNSPPTTSAPKTTTPRPNTPLTCSPITQTLKCYSIYSSVTDTWCNDNCRRKFCPPYFCYCVCREKPVVITTPVPRILCRSITAGVSDVYCFNNCRLGYCPAGYCECRFATKK